jgi:hypothetical protein
MHRFMIDAFGKLHDLPIQLRIAKPILVAEV